MRRREGSSGALKRRGKTQSKGRKVTPSDTWMRKEPVSLVEAGGPNGPITLWDYVPGYKGDSGTSRYDASRISPSVPILPWYLFLSLSLFLYSSYDFTSLMHDCRSYSNARLCKPEMMALTNPRYDSRLGDTLREGPSGEEQAYSGHKGSRRTTGDVDETSAILPVWSFFVTRVTLCGWYSFISSLYAGFFYRLYFHWYNNW